MKIYGWIMSVLCLLGILQTDMEMFAGAPVVFFVGYFGILLFPMITLYYIYYGKK